MNTKTTNIQSSTLWSKSFGAKNDGHDNHRERLSQSLIRFRERVGHLLTFINADMKSFTVHDLTHLDALWEMADLITGGDFELNPAEAYVLGGAILLHDAAMSVAAYTNGLNDIKSDPQWEDVISSSRMAIKGRDDADVEQRVNDIAVMNFLRLKHAEQAERLATQKWKHPSSRNDDEFLIEDSELRAHYGDLIGKVAHSHHWDVFRLQNDIQTSLGAFGEMPASWTVDSIKVALLLRCSDAAHIDSRRAPRFLMTLTKPSSVSKIHWTFQEKLAKPILKDSKIVYTSISPFTFDEATAWHLCSDVIRMIDKELDDAQEILIERQIRPFRATGVVGAKSTKSLVDHVRVSGWQPLPTEIQVSDVQSLASTLGGKDLYSFAFTPIRELIQNSADAIEARSLIDPDFKLNEGEITIKITRDKSGVLESIEVNDNGIGMSDRTLTRTMLDFGKSFWKSEEIRSEFPGLKSKFLKPRGRFGIGFFSIFMWSDSAIISSRKFNQGTNDSKTMVFKDSLNARPIIRNSLSQEVSTKYQTKVKIFTRKNLEEELFSPTAPQASRRLYLKVSSGRPIKDWASAITRICAPLEINVWLEDGDERTLISRPDWKTARVEYFLEMYEKLVGSIHPIHKRLMKCASEIVRDGVVIGRAFMACKNEQLSLNAQTLPLFVYEKGIYVGMMNDGPYGGVIEGTAANAARDKVKSISLSNQDEWIRAQMQHTFTNATNIGEKIGFQASLLILGYISDECPTFFWNREILSLKEICDRLTKRDSIQILLERPSSAAPSDGEIYSILSSDRLAFITNIDVSPNTIASIISIPGDIEISKCSFEESIIHARQPTVHVIKTLASALGEGSKMSLVELQDKNETIRNNRKAFAIRIVGPG